MKVSVVKFLWPYFYKLRVPLFISIFVASAGEVFSRIGAYYASCLIGLISETLSNRAAVVSEALFYIFIFTILMALRGITVNFAILIDAHFLPSVQARVYKDLFAIAHKHSPAFFEQEMSGNISSKIENVVSMIERFYYAVVWIIINPSMVLLISLVCLFLVNVYLAFILLALILLYIYLMYKSSKIIMPYTKETVRLNSLANGELVDSLINAEVVKSFGQRFFENKYYFNKLLKVAMAERKEINTSGWIYILQSTMRSVIQIAFCIIPLIFWYKGILSLQEFVFVQSIIMSLIYVFSSMIDMFLKLFARYSIIHDGLSLLLKENHIADLPNAPDLKVSEGEIRFNKVTYSYDVSSPIFQDFSLTIKPKNKVGLVGYSGSGKSTLIKLLNRHYDIEGGNIEIDGQDISKIKQKSLHANIAMIPQEPNLFNRTIMENIRYGNLNASDEQVYEAAKKAYCHDFILKLPQGYNSRVGERGVMLSGGERQRIAIARAILKDAPILILDEATSALDSESEKYIQSSLASLMEGKTVIAIAHRLSTLNRMDEIVVLDKGKIAEKGGHKSLLRKKGIFHKFYNMQKSLPA